MPRRSSFDTHASEVARRRLEALSRELGLDAPAGPAAAVPAADDAVPTAEEHDLRPSGRAGGRHALPRLGRRERLALWAAERLPGGRAPQFGSAHLAVAAVVVAASLALGAWHVLRASSTAEPAPVSAPVIAAPDATAAESSSAADAGGDALAPTSDGAETPGAEIVVDVVGRVRKPGIAVLAAGSRVVDALKAAGGLRPGTRPDGLNLARPLVDGEQIVVGRTAVPPATAAPVPGAVAAPGAPSAAPVNLNTADAAALDTLPGVGPVTAAAILEWREQHGGFTAVEELLEVSGIGETTLAEIAPHVTL